MLLSRVSRAQKRVHALLRARVCSACVCRVPCRIDGESRRERKERRGRKTRKRERKRDTSRFSFSFEKVYPDTPVIRLLSVVAGRLGREREGFAPKTGGRDRSRINYAARFIGRRSRAVSCALRLRALSRAQSYVIFMKSRPRGEPVPRCVPGVSNLSETRERKFARRSAAL